MDPEHIGRLETLAGIVCDPDEREALRCDLQAMITFVDRLADYVRDWLPPPPRNGVAVGARRRDEPQASLPRPEALSGAPEVADGCFLTPPVRARGDGDD